MKKKRLNNENLFLTTKTFSQKNEDMIGAISTFEVGEHHQAKLYYDSGLPEFDELFKPEGYIKLGYVCQLLSTKDGISLYLTKRVKDYTEELAAAHIHRSSIIDYEIQEANNLTFVKRENLKHKAKLLGRSAFGLVGSVTGLIADNFTIVNTEKLRGYVIRLNYINKEASLSNLTLYCSSEFSYEITLFLNTYWKSELPKELIADKNSNNNSNCFIATACYKDLYSVEVIAFRKFRDEKLKKYLLGRLFIKIYYILSPRIYRLIYKSDKTSSTIKKILDKVYLNIKH